MGCNHELCYYQSLIVIMGGQEIPWETYHTCLKQKRYYFHQKSLKNTIYTIYDIKQSKNILYMAAQGVQEPFLPSLDAMIKFWKGSSNFSKRCFTLGSNYYCYFFEKKCTVHGLKTNSGFLRLNFVYRIASCAEAVVSTFYNEIIGLLEVSLIFQ